MKTIIERGASWTLEETRLLLSIWGQDLVQRQTTCLKRTKETYEKISESFAQNGYVRTADQVRTRIFNMIAEYRRILRDPSQEKRKKCIFFDPLHKIYQAKHMDDVKSALDDYEPENPYSPASNTIMSDRGDESISDSDVLDDTLFSDGHAATNNNSNTNTNSDNATNSNPNDVAAGPQSNSNKNINNNNNKTSATSDNNGDSINDSNDDITTIATAQTNIKDTSEKDSASISNHQSSSAKKIKLESSPKASTSQAAAAAAAASASDKVKTYHSCAVNSGVRQQSLLLPHGAPVSASTSINKLTTSGNNLTPSYININSTKMPVIRTNQFLGHTNGNESTININGTPTTATRLPTTAAITGHQLYQAPVNTFDVTSSALLIDRMFAHLSRESENMRDWIALEKERIALERARRAQETEREVRRERVLIDTLMRFHESWINFIGRLDPKLVEAAAADNPMPELHIPPRESGDKQAADQVTSQTNSTISGPSQSSSAATSSTAPATLASAVASTTANTSTTTTTTTTAGSNT